MKAKLSVMFSALSGRAKNVVAKGSSRGQIMMIRSIGKDRRTEQQMSVRQRFQGFAALWKTLTNAQREAWSIPDDGFVSNFSRFRYQNANLHSIGLPPILTVNDTRLKTFQASLFMHLDWDKEILFFENISLQKTKDCTLLITMAPPTIERLSLKTYKPRNIGRVSAAGGKSRNFFPIIKQYGWKFDGDVMQTRIQVFVISEISGFKYLCVDKINAIQREVGFDFVITKISPVLP